MKFELFLSKSKNAPPPSKTVAFLQDKPNTDKNALFRRALEHSTSFIIAPTLAAYKKSLTKKLILGFFLFLCFIFERIFHQTIQNQEIELIIGLQQAWFEYFPDSHNFYYYLGMLGDFHIFFLLITHYFITLYVGVDAMIALKIIYTTIISSFFLVMLSFINSEERPYWANSNIKAFFCDRTFSDPGIFSFVYLFLIVYSYQCFNRKEEELLAISPFETSFSEFGEESINEKQKEWIHRVISFFCLICYLFLMFMRFLMGLEYLINYFLSFILFIIIFGLVFNGETFLEDLIKKSTILKLYAKSEIFKWLIYLLLLEGLGCVVYHQTDYKKDLYYIQNFFTCKTQSSVIQEGYFKYDEILGKKETFQETSLIFALIGLLFGAAQTFRAISSMNWYKGPWKFRFLRILIVNLAMIPSWILINYQEDLINLSFLKLLGLSNFMIDCFHYFLLYYGLFGFIPVYIYLYYGWVFVDLKLSLVLTH